MHGADWSDVRLAADRMIDTVVHADGRNQHEKGRDLFAASWQLADQLLDDAQATPDLIQGGVLLGCLPSLERLSTGLAHDLTVARAVNVGFLPVAELILKDRLYKARDPAVIGATSEFSALAVIWWAIENGYLSEKSHALPTTVSKDASAATGLRTGTDILLTEGRPRRNIRHKLQVKTSAGPTSNTYHPKIAIIPLNQVVPAGQKYRANHTILDNIVSGAHNVLAQTWGNIETELRKTADQRLAERKTGSTVAQSNPIVRC